MADYTMNLSYRRMSDVSMVSLDTATSTISPAGPSTPADSFGAFSSTSNSSGQHVMTPDSSSIMAGNTFSYPHDLVSHSWHLAGGHDGHAAHSTSLDTMGAENYCGMSPHDVFRYSSFSTDSSNVVDFSHSLGSDPSMTELVGHDLHTFSPTWSPGRSETHSTVSPTETFHIPDMVTGPVAGFDQVTWDFPSEPSCQLSPYHSLNLHTPPPSPHRPLTSRRSYKQSHVESQSHTRAVRSGRVQKTQSSTPSTKRIRHPCNEIIYIHGSDGSVRPMLDAEGKPKICTKSFVRAEHLTRHKRCTAHSKVASEVFCPVEGCKKSREAEKSSSFGGARRDNLNDHFKKTHCVKSDHNGRNDRISRKDAESYGPEWLQLWDDAQPDKKLRELRRIWNPHGDSDQDPHQVVDFFLANDLRLSPTQLRKALKNTALENHILGLLPPRDELRATKGASRRPRPRHSAIRS